MVKLKRGRLWYVACKTPIPFPPGPIFTPGATISGGAVLRPIRQPLYDSNVLDPGAPIRNLFQNDAVGEYGYYWGDGDEIVWKSNWDAAIPFDTREEAEGRAFVVVTQWPHLLGKVLVMKLKVRFGVSV